MPSDTQDIRFPPAAADGRGAAFPFIDRRRSSRRARRTNGRTREGSSSHRTPHGRSEDPPAGAIIATTAAVGEIMRLRAEHNVVAFRNSDSSGPSTPVIEAELPREPNDLELGGIGGLPFLIDADRYRRWGCPDLIVDVERSAEGRPLAELGERTRLMLLISRRPGI